MNPSTSHYYFGGGSSSTVLSPWVAVATVLVLILIFCLRRKQVLAPLLLGLFLIPKGEVLLLAGLHFNVYRIILLAGAIRWMVSRRSSPLAGRFNSIDLLFTLWALSLFIAFSIHWGQIGAVIEASGNFLDTLCGYFVLRFLIQDREDLRRVITVFAFLAIIEGACMLNEQRTGTNIFGQLGGVGSVSEVRDGKIRSQGSFEHEILAGSYGATVLPLLVWLWSDAKSRKLVFLGLIGATVMVVTARSSTSFAVYAAGILALCLWPLRRQMYLIRWGIVASLIGLQLIMKGPVWSLLEHIDLTGSSSGYHRYQLINQFLMHISDWWLVGTRNNGSWGWEMRDTSNEYVTYGINGGLVAFLLFIAIISRAFGKLGTARKAVEGDTAEAWFFWCLGAAVFAHVVAYFGIDYFDQMRFAWYALLAMISMSVFKARTVRQRKAWPAFVTTFPESLSSDAGSISQ